MEVFNCKIPFCGFSAATSHGLATHVSMCHKSDNSIVATSRAPDHRANKKPPVLEQETLIKAPGRYKRRLSDINRSPKEPLRNSFTTQVAIPNQLKTGDRFHLNEVIPFDGTCSRGVEVLEGASGSEMVEISSDIPEIFSCSPAVLLPENQPINKRSNCTTSEIKDDAERLCRAFMKIAEVLPATIVHAFYGTLVEEKQNLEKFFTSFTSIKDIKVYSAKQMHRQLVDQGFERKDFETSVGLSCTLFLKNAASVLEQQISAVNNDDFYHEPGPQVPQSHPMNAKLGVFARDAVEQHIKSSEMLESIWNIGSHDKWKSVVGCVQLYSDKSQTSLKAGGLTFYPLHITLMNFSEKIRRLQIMSGATVLGYLPVEFHSSSSDNLQANSKSKGQFRVGALRALHECIELCLMPLAEKAQCGHACRTKCGTCIKVHFALTSYIADIPETEDLLGIKRGGQTKFPCHQCMVRKDKLHLSSQFPRRCIQHSRDMMERASSTSLMGRDLEQFFGEESMLPLLPVLSDFPFVGTQPTLDIYSIFRYEPMHCLSLGVGRTLKECIVHMLGDEQRVSSDMRCQNGTMKSFKSIKRTVLSTLNAFLERCSSEAPGYGLKVDFSKPGNSSRLTGLFNENGLHGMLEASDYDAVDNVSPFLGAIVDSLCGLNSTAEVTKAMTEYVDMVNFVFRRHLNFEWTKETIVLLDRRIRSFKKAKFAFEKYQVSGMHTQKWHALDHLCEAISDVGGIESLHGGIYEASHKRFKLFYSRSSRRKRTAMDEIISMQNAESSECFNEFIENRTSAVALNGCVDEARKSDSSFLTRNGAKSSLSDLETIMFAVEERSGECSDVDTGTTGSKRLLERLQCDGFRVLVRLLRSYFVERGEDLNIARHKVIRLPKSAYVSSCRAPTLRDRVKNGFVEFDDDGWRVIQRAVATDSFYGSSEGRYDTVLVSGEEDSDIPKNGCRSRKISVWIGKVLSFLRIASDVLENGLCPSHKKTCCIKCAYDAGKELCFVQWYEVLSNKIEKIDEIEKTLECLRIRWHRNPGSESNLSPSKEYALIPVESIRGVVHVVKRKFELPVLTEPTCQRMDAERTGGSDVGWLSETFYVNRFYKYRLPSRSQEHSIEL
ncbi:MAG: hypothetical protein HC936_08975 [Leptolyngbyaceae cyanobacterium SU_3_3]|nr:hypothetical protein [Leptolyngbyaceae cyanobacterium SU_3_3]